MKKLVAVLSLVTISSTVFAAPLKYSCGMSYGQEITLDIEENPEGRMPLRAVFTTHGQESDTRELIRSKPFKMEGDLGDKKKGNKIVKRYVFNDTENIYHSVVLDQKRVDGQILSGHEIYIDKSGQLIGLPEELDCNLVK